MGSIDSSIFKNSLHQNSLEKSNTIRTDSTKIVSRAEIHNDGVSNKSENHGSENVKSPNSININEDSESGITIIEIKDRQQYSGPTSSVISYDSIYLSSESDRQTVLGETVENLDAKIKDFEEIIKELNIESGKSESIIDNLYSQVGKGKAEASAVEPKINPDSLSKYTDYISRGTLERLTILTGITGRAPCERRSAKSKSSSATEFQYSSLPDAGVSKLLRDCERIDANLRDDVSVELLEPYPDYDSLPSEVNEGKEDPSKTLNEEEKFEGVKSSIEPISLGENPKGAPSIELVQLPTKELIDNKDCRIPNEIVRSNHTTKIYLPDIGVEFDYENSIASFESDSDFESPPPAFCKPPIFNLVTISGRKVIVDELAAKVEQKVDNKKVASEQIVVDGSVKTEAKANANVSSSTVETKKIVKKANNDDKNKAYNDREKKIKLSESKQQSVDNSDKKILFHLKHVEPKEEEKKVAVQSETDCKSFRLLRRNCLSFNMPRPQLLSIIDSKNSVPKRDHRNGKTDAKVEKDKAPVINQTEREFLHKVDSVRNYWSKLADEERVEHASNLKQMSKNFLSSKSSNDIPEALKNEDFQSFFPTVEIVELNGETQAALVTSRKLNDVEFDHVRYKVMKSEMFQKNLLISNHKETQFDGLVQYLQDYSFQELLANNNVVIIEPVRTKVEKVSEQPNKAQSAACKITNGALNRNGSNNLKKHFFYHPIRVNKELYEEELPVPDTVRNVRKLFEGSLKRATLSKVDDDSKLSSDSMRRKTIRYLTIDTSFDNNMAAAKWDSISLSSGVSSAADLNSPCECQDASNKDIKFVCTSRENLDNHDDDNDDDGESKSSFVSADVLEKIRECGSSITYYGGQTKGAKINSDMMTKAIMREISNQKCNCQSRRPRQVTSNEKSIRKVSNDYSGEMINCCGNMNKDFKMLIFPSGVCFKLVKSNSCSSRLELTGTGLEKSHFTAMEEMKNIIHSQRDSSPGDDKKDLSEETVKDIVSKLESKSVVPTKPRIIESSCIEKVRRESSPKVTINHQTFEKVKTTPNENVTVNNHISVLNSGSNSLQDEIVDVNVAKPKVVRNKNVDLAMASVAKRNEHLKNPKASSGDTENLAQKETLLDSTNIKTAKWSNICKMESVEMVKHQDKINIKSHPQTEAFTPKSMTDIKMVNWSTVGSALGKEYIANDRSLVQSKIYDEMEFEEFEVMGEHYDSLNSK